MSFQAKRWRDVSPRPDYLPSSLLNTIEAANFLGCDRRTLQRAVRRGEGPEPEPDEFTGRAVWFSAWKLVAWRSDIVGAGPTTYDEVIAWWPCNDSLIESSRVKPEKRPTWWPRGERRYEAKRRIVTNFRARLARIDLLVVLAVSSSALAQHELSEALG
jgi:hypothetical protein